MIKNYTLEEIEEKHNITFPIKWKNFYKKNYYTESIININELGTSYPFGPYDWMCISAEDILKHLKGYTMKKDIRLVNHTLCVLERLKEAKNERYVIEKLEDILEYETSGKYIEGRYENETFIDIAIKGIAMGQYLVLSMTKDGKHFFFRKDGGSNAYDRYHNTQIYKNWNPMLPELKDRVFNINQIIDMLKDENAISNILETYHEGFDIKVDYNELTRDYDNIIYVNNIAKEYNIEFSQ